MSAVTQPPSQARPLARIKAVPVASGRAITVAIPDTLSDRRKASSSSGVRAGIMCQWSYQASGGRLDHDRHGLTIPRAWPVPDAGLLAYFLAVTAAASSALALTASLRT